MKKPKKKAKAADKAASKVAADAERVLGVKIPTARLTPISSLKPHPRNYKTHPEEQLRHLAESLKQSGFYRNIVAAEDSTILAGHGIVEAAKLVSLTDVPVVVMPFAHDDPRALKILAADNELGRFADTDDRALSELLKDIMETTPEGLLGTGYDEQALAAMLMVTRPASEIGDFDAATEWVGMPEFDPGQGKPFILNVQCATEEARDEVLRRLGMKTAGYKTKQGKVWSTWFPPREQEDLQSLQWKEGDSDAEDSA